MSPSRLTFVALLCIAPAFGAFPTGWLRQTKLTIQHAQIPANQTAFPVLITAATLPAEMLTTGGGNAAQADGGDIRFSTDVAGASQLACEIVVWTQNANPALAVAEIWVPVSILTASNVDIYVWYKAGGGITQPAANAAFGSQAVWDANFAGVYHLQSLTTDSTSNANTATTSGTTSTAAQINNGGNFNGSSFSSLPDNASLKIIDPITMSAWVNITTFPTTGAEVDIVYKGLNASTVGYALLLNNPSGTVQLWAGSFGFGWANVAWPIAGWTTGTWHHIVGLYRVNIWHLYFDGVEEANHPEANGGRAVNNVVYIGARSGTASLTGKLDELRISNIARSDTWITTEYNNQLAPSSFLVAGTPGPAPGTGAVAGARTLIGVGQ